MRTRITFFAACVPLAMLSASCVPTATGAGATHRPDGALNSRAHNGTGADSGPLVIDASFTQTQADVAQSIAKSGKPNVLELDVRPGARWESLAIASAGAVGARVATAKIRSAGDQTTISLDSAGTEPLGWLILELAPDSLTASVWTVAESPLGQGRPSSQRLSLAEPALRDWIKSTCNARRCAEILVSADRSYSAQAGVHAVALFLAAWTFPEQPLVRFLPDRLMSVRKTPGKGSLPPELLQHIVRRAYSSMATCYEPALASKPRLAGTVLAQVELSASGKVASVSDHGSSLAEQTVIACVLGIFRNLKFPVPDGGPLSMTYPVEFSPD